MTTSFMEHMVAHPFGQMIEKNLLPCILWGSDHPHFDSTYPGAYTAAQETFDAASADPAQQIVCENPPRFIALAPR